MFGWHFVSWNFVVLPFKTETDYTIVYLSPYIYNASNSESNDIQVGTKKILNSNRHRHKSFLRE